MDELSPVSVQALAVTDTVPREVMTPLLLRKTSINVPGVPSGPVDVPDMDVEPPMIGEVTVGTGETGVITVTLEELVEKVSLLLLDPSLFVSIRALAVRVSPARRVLLERLSSVHEPLVTVVVLSDTVVELRVRKTSITVPSAPLDAPEMEALPATTGDAMVGIGETALATVTDNDVADTAFPAAVALAVRISLVWSVEDVNVVPVSVNVHALVVTVVDPIRDTEEQFPPPRAQ